MKKLSMVLFVAGMTVMALGQAYSTKSQRALRNFEKARNCFENLDDACAEEALQKALRADPEFVEALQMMAQVCYDQGRVPDAIQYYSRSLEVDPESNPDGYRILAGLTLRTGDYQRTLELIETFLGFSPEKVRNREEGLRIRATCLFAMEALLHPVPFDPVNLGDSVNSTYSEYWPSLTVDEEVLMFTVLLPVPGSGGGRDRFQEDLFTARRNGIGWHERSGAGSPLNTPDNEGASTMSADGRILYFTACNRRDGQGQCDIYRSVLLNGRWSKPQNIGIPVNSRYSEKHPAISPDGRYLYFTSDRPGGKGSFDIWVSAWDGEKWGAPVNLGDSVNTPAMEQSPFIHPDQQSLYFSSDGWPGMGRGDLFLCRQDTAGYWRAPVNLGYPINTFHDEIGLSINASGSRAFFASDRDGGDDTDLFTFELPAGVRPVQVSFMKGRIYDSKNMKGIPAAMELTDLASGQVVLEMGTDAEGHYLLSLPAGRDYALNISAEGYLFYSEHFAFSGTYTRAEPMRRDIPMERIEAGSSVVLNNVFYKVDSYQLERASRAELDQVAGFLLSHPGITVEIGGHTDNTGSQEYNLKLSEQRAEAVVHYLMEQGVPGESLKARGYGETIPAGDNSTEEGRAMNRRTELRILRTDPD